MDTPIYSNTDPYRIVSNSAAVQSSNFSAMRNTAGLLIKLHDPTSCVICRAIFLLARSHHPIKPFGKNVSLSSILEESFRLPKAVRMIGSLNTRWLFRPPKTSQSKTSKNKPARKKRTLYSEGPYDC